MNFLRAECTSGNYGVNCEQKCSERCSSTSCDVYTGVCNKGCTTNYIAPDCKESKAKLLSLYGIMSVLKKKILRYNSFCD